VKEAMQNLRANGIGILTLGPYLHPTPLHATVKECINESWREKVDILVLGGGMIITLYKAQVFSLGSILVDEDKFVHATSLP
jgi:lipoate synthase